MWITGYSMRKLPETEYISIGEAARMLHVSTATLRRWDEAGVLRALRLTPLSDRKYNFDDVMQLLNQGLKQSEQPHSRKAKTKKNGKK